MDKYEHNLRWTGERVVPEKMSEGSSDREIHNKTGIYKKHIERYAFAEPFTRDKTVLDAACGAGYGLMLYEFAKERTGVDISVETINYCKERYPNINFIVSDLEKPLEFKKCDVVTSFETIEHLKDPSNFLKSVKGIITDKFIFSVPINNKGRYHEVIYSVDDIKALIGKYFDDVEYIMQGDNINGNFRHKFVWGIARV
jgi:2-polyprenyl-3-methyl-5-hydroxy-6-metoxy-1,4-benzoquinol methylase